MRRFDEINGIEHSAGFMQLKIWLCAALVAGSACAVFAQDAPPTQATNQTYTTTTTTNAATNEIAAPPQSQSLTMAPRKTRVVTLADCIQLALEHNLDIQIQRYNPIISQYDLNGSYGVYEPSLGAGLGRNY